jgi:uncharacterized protein YjbJ (UPF0337 family)
MRKTQLTILAGSLALATWPVLAQTAAPTSSASSAAGSSGFSWLWLIVLLAVIGAAAWYFGYARNRTHTTNSMGVDRDRVAGSAEQAKGSVKEGVGNVLGDTKLQAEGRADQAEGKAQNTAGGIKDTLRGQ